jgi:hypothetical protein
VRQFTKRRHPLGDLRLMARFFLEGVAFRRLLWLATGLRRRLDFFGMNENQLIN